MRPVITLKPRVIDPSRMGGSFAPHRHAFGYGQPAGPPPARPVAQPPSALPSGSLQPPPKRAFLGQDIAPAVTESEIAIIRSKAEDAIALLQMELEAVKMEMDLVTPDALRDAPTGFTGIEIIGNDFTALEVRTQVSVVARQIETVAQRLLSGSASSYLTDDQKTALAVVMNDAQGLSAFATQFDTEPIAAAHTRLSEQHLEIHTKGAKDAINTVEKDIVSAEGNGIDVREPMEKEASALGVVLGLGVLTVIGLVVFEVL